MDTTLRPISNRERVITGFNGIPSFISKILERTAPHLQVQYNDTNNKCIGKSPVLRPEIKITKVGHLHQTTFIPKNTNDPDLKINWNIKQPILSKKDKRGILLRDIKNNFSYYQKSK